MHFLIFGPFTVYIDLVQFVLQTNWHCAFSHLSRYTNSTILIFPNREFQCDVAHFCPDPDTANYLSSFPKILTWCIYYKKAYVNRPKLPAKGTLTAEI